MKNVIKKILGIMILTILIIAGNQGFELRAEQTVDDFLSETGMLQEVIDPDSSRLNE